MDGSKFAENIVQLLGCDFVWKVFDVENSVDLGRQFAPTNATRCHSHFSVFF
jgi:hypothetical protein